MIYLPNILLSIPRNPVTAVGLPLTLGFLSGSPVSTAASNFCYKGLYAPAGQPKRETSPFVWTLLYLSVGYASHVAVKALDTTTRPAHRDHISLGLALYYGQLGLNCLWSPLFFAGKSMNWALLDSLLLTGTTFYMTKLLDRPTNAEATYFLLPYCGWLGYATYLNVGAWWFNLDKRRA